MSDHPQAEFDVRYYMHEQNKEGFAFFASDELAIIMNVPMESDAEKTDLIRIIGSRDVSVTSFLARHPGLAEVSEDRVVEVLNKRLREMALQYGKSKFDALLSYTLSLVF